MDTSTGKIIHVPQGQAAPHGSVSLTEHEVKGWRSMTGSERLRAYKRAHGDEPCRSCGNLLDAHSVKDFQRCYSE